MTDLKAIRSAAEAATKGSWRVTAQGKHVVSADSGRICASPEHMAQWNWDANAKHIATANPATILELLDRLEAAEKDAARLEHKVSHLEQVIAAMKDEQK